MPRPKLLESVVMQRQKDKQRRTQLFQRIKKVFNNKELKLLLNYTFYDISSYFIPNVVNLTSWLFINNNVDPFNLSDEDFKGLIIKSFTDVQPTEIIKVEDDIGDFPKEEHIESEIDPTPQPSEEAEHYENFELTSEENAESEKMIREELFFDEKNSLKPVVSKNFFMRRIFFPFSKIFKFFSS